MVYPKDVNPSKAWYKRAASQLRNAATSLIGLSSSSLKSPDDSIKKDLEICTPFEMGTICLQEYLREHKEMLCSGCFPQHANLRAIAEEICHIFNLLFQPIIIYGISSTGTKKKLDEKFKEVFFPCMPFCYLQQLIL